MSITQERFNEITSTVSKNAVELAVKDRLTERGSYLRPVEPGMTNAKSYLDCFAYVMREMSDTLNASEAIERELIADLVIEHYPKGDGAFRQKFHQLPEGTKGADSGASHNPLFDKYVKAHL